MSIQEMKSLSTIQRVKGTSFFTMDYVDDYRLDDFLKVGAASDAEVKNFITQNLLNGMSIDFELPKLGCSTFSAKLSDGSSVFGRNFDEAECPCMLVTTHPKTGYASISMVNLLYIGFSADKLPLSVEESYMAMGAPYVPLDGVNEKGLSARVLYIDTVPTNQNTGKTNITTTTAVRMMLDRCATVEEAVEMLANYDMHSSASACFHLHIADAHGGSVVVEYVNDEMKVVKETAVTNFLFNPIPGVREIGRDRYDTMKERLAENGGVFSDMCDAMSLLKDASRERTRWSSIYNQTKPELLLSVYRDYEKLYRFTLD